MKLFIFLVLLLSPIFSLACVETVERVANIQLQVVNSNSGNCYVTVTPREIVNLTYRSFLISSDGEFMVFMSYGPGDEAKTTGAREFFFFPRNSNLAYEFSDADRLLFVTTANGDILSFNYDSGDLVASSKGKVSVNPKIQVGDFGGVEFSNYNGLYLDSGFALGKAPVSISGAQSVFHLNQSSCKVVNRKVFNYLPDGDIKFKFSDAQLDQFLKKECSLK